MFTEVQKCRICGNPDLISVLDLGNQVLTGVFPKVKDQKISVGPLELIKCKEDSQGQHCGLLQLKQSYDTSEMYGDNYGYRSGLNRSMVSHLQEKMNKILRVVPLASGDLVLDIGSNDGTFLRAYPDRNLSLVGVDPTGRKFKKYYTDNIRLIPDFFSSKIFRSHLGSKKAKIITSIAMFYDLESPIDFMSQVYDVLAQDGVWVFEQSYMPAMLQANAYDTICHEHLEYYRLKQIKWMADRVGFKIIDIEFNSVNGGSFSVMAAKKENSSYEEKKDLIKKILTEEERLGFSCMKPYEKFKQGTYSHRDDLLKFIRKAKAEKKKIFGYGASTKGNVILQFCGIGEGDIPCIAEVNEDKFGCFTPGTGIPIISEAEAKALHPDYFLVLPWHFKENILEREKEYLESGGTLVFPLPAIEAVAKQKQ